MDYTRRGSAIQQRSGAGTRCAAESAGVCVWWCHLLGRAEDAPLLGRAKYRADWEPATTSGRRALSVFSRYSAVLWGSSTPNPTQISWKPLILKKLADLSCVMWICGGFAPCGPSALLATKKASFGIKTCHLAISLIMQRKMQTFQTYRFFIFFMSQRVFFLWVKKWYFGSKTGVLGCFGLSMREQT